MPVSLKRAAPYPPVQGANLPLVGLRQGRRWVGGQVFHLSLTSRRSTRGSSWSWRSRAVQIPG